MILAPIAAVILNWRLKEFLLAFAIASGLLMGNLGQRPWRSRRWPQANFTERPATR